MLSIEKQKTIAIIHTYLFLRIKIMVYNEKIAMITGQDSISHEILYDMHNTRYQIYKIIGEIGTGKRTLCEFITESWVSQTKGNTFYLTASYRQIPEDYSTFKKLIERNCNEKKLFNIFTDVLKDIPYLGNSLSAIAKEVITTLDQRADLEEEYDENEKYIFSALKRKVQNKDSLFLCFDYELWDLKSKRILSNFLEYAKYNFSEIKVHFIFVSAQNEISPFDSKLQKKFLNRIQKEDLGEITKQFNPNISLGGDQIEQIFELTKGNLELIRESINLFQTDRMPISHSFYDILKKHISNSCSEPEEILELLKQAAFIGDNMDSRLLKMFADIGKDLYEQILDEIIRLCYLREENYNIYFSKQSIYAIVKDCLIKNRKYYLSLSKCISVLYPTRYDLQMQYLYRGNLTNQADRFFFIYLIGYYRENSIKYALNETDSTRLASNPLHSVYMQICNSYKLYKNREYKEAEAKLINLYCEDIAFRFEKDYLLSLIVTNKYYTKEEFEERINVLSTYVTDDFENLFPEMHLRALMMLAEFYAEIMDEKELRICLKKINRCFAKYSATDRQIQCYEHCFRLKANAFYKIEMAWKQTESAFSYFNQPNNIQQYSSKYYLSILNHSANEIVLGNYQKAHEMLLKAHNIIRKRTYLKSIHEDILLNNLAISGFLNKSYSATDCITALENVISKNKETADYILLQNNIATFYAMDRQFDTALSICSSLYQQIEFNEDIDDYYRYYILNNYGMLLWINQKQPQAVKVLSKAFSLNPLPRDHAYFTARTQKILSLIENKLATSLLNIEEWNCILYKESPNVVGQAWKFWSSLLLFSELQIWSDF